MAKLTPNEVTHTLARLARPGVELPAARYDQFIQKRDVLHSNSTAQEIFNIALKGLGYLDEDAQRMLTEEASRLSKFNTRSLKESQEVLTPQAEIVFGYNALDEAVADRYDRLFDEVLQASRNFAFGAVATAKLVEIEYHKAS